MNKKIYTLDEIKQLLHPIAARYDIQQIKLFGSYAVGCATDASDLDFYIQKRRGARVRLTSIYADLEDTFGKDIDVVTNDGLESSVHPEVAKRLEQEIKETGVTIYGAD